MGVKTEIAEFAYLIWYNGRSKLVKVLLSLLWCIPNNIYRICASAKHKNTLGIVLGIFMLIFGGLLVFIVIDIVTIILSNKIIWFNH